MLSSFVSTVIARLRGRTQSRTALAAVFVAVSASNASAGIVTTLSAGEGGNLSTIQVDFSNGNGYLLEYRWDGAATGFSALLALDALLPEFTMIYEDTVFGPLVTGFGVLGDNEYGTGDQWPVVENYWHYWLKDTGAWNFASEGATSRNLFDGSFDAWVFGSSAVPQPVPAPSALLVAAAAIRSLRRRRCNAASVLPSRA